MPRSLIVLVCLITLIGSSANGESTFPYKAIVAVEGTEVLSGPGKNYYPTDKLQKGEIVEVYRHDAGGWYAIRPPEGSFTWIPSQYLKLEDDNLAVVTEDDVGARVGSRLTSTRDAIQVRMHKGEAVEILGAREIPGSNSRIWYKIRPPAGEFRWISSKYIDAQGPQDKQSSDDVASDEDSSRDGAEEKSSTGKREVSAEEFQAELDRLELDLSMMVVEEPSAWSFDALRIRAETLLDLANTTVQRGNARLLLNKIARFEDIKQRYDSVAAIRQQNAISNRFLDGLKQTMEKVAAMADPEKQFDGVGQLQQVVSTKLGTPRYALVDEAGNVKYYVTPAPGVNLQNYVGRQVGVNGTRGYMPEQRAQHITARHVTSLESRLR